MMESSIVKIAGFDAQLTRKPVKNLSIKIKNGALIVAAPLFIPMREIERFVAAKSAWISKHLATQPPPLALTGGETVRLWGAGHTLSILPAARGGITARGGEVVMRCPAGADRDARERLLNNLYRKEVTARTAAVLARWESLTGLRASRITVRSMTSRWGTCSPASGRISLSLHLAKYPPECLDYVIVHELCHLKVPNHSAAFKALMDHYYPNWRAVKKLLKT